MRGEPGIVDVPRERQDGGPDHLRRFGPLDPEGLRALVALDVDLPRDAFGIQAIEDGGKRTEAAGRDLLGFRVPRGSRHPEHVIPETPAAGRREVVVKQHVLARDVPVVRKGGLVVVRHGEVGRHGAAAERGDEAVHGALGVLRLEHRAAHGEILARASGDRERLDATAGKPATVLRHAGGGRYPVRARECPEVVVEGVILL